MWLASWMQAAFCEESGGVILPHALCSPESRVHEYSGTRDAVRLGQADTAISSSPRGSSGRQNTAYGLPHPAGPDVLGGENWQILTTEMKRFEYDISPSGGITYNALAGFHDDCVTALALANHGRWDPSSPCGLRRDKAGELRKHGGIWWRRKAACGAGREAGADTGGVRTASGSRA